MNQVFGHQVDDFIFKMMLFAGAYTVTTIIATFIIVISHR